MLVIGSYASYCVWKILVALSTKPSDQRERLRGAGAPISAIGYGSGEWRRGIMPDANIL